MNDSIRIEVVGGKTRLYLPADTEIVLGNAKALKLDAPRQDTTKPTRRPRRTAKRTTRKAIRQAAAATKPLAGQTPAEVTKPRRAGRKLASDGPSVPARILSVLANGASTAKDLAFRLGLKSSQVSSAVASLEKSGRAFRRDGHVFAGDANGSAPMLTPTPPPSNGAVHQEALS